MHRLNGGYRSIMDMNKSFFLRKEDKQSQWRLIDATDKILGRLSTEIADALRGKDKPEYTPHGDAGDYVVVVNCDKIRLTGSKWDTKEYERYTGWIGGKRFTAAKDMKKEDLILHSVKGMLPKNRLSRQLMRKLKVYVGNEHPHKAQLKSM